jgi:hypothetical protein
MMHTLNVVLLAAGLLFDAAHGAASQAYTWNNVVTGGKCTEYCLPVPLADSNIQEAEASFQESFSIHQPRE